MFSPICADEAHFDFDGMRVSANKYHRYETNMLKLQCTLCVPGIRNASILMKIGNENMCQYFGFGDTFTDQHCDDDQGEIA